MKSIGSFFFFLLCSFYVSNAATITVVNGDDLASKINAATAGDILIVGPGTYTGNFVVSKKLTFMGPGYLRSSGGDAFIAGYVLFASGSDGSYFSGFRVRDDLSVLSNNTTIIRNNVGHSLLIGTDGSSNANTSGVKVLQNYLCTNNIAVSDVNRVYVGGWSIYTQTNYLFKNNIVMTKIHFNHSNASTGVVENNVFDPDNNNYSHAGYFNNNYKVTGGINGISFYNNIFKGNFPNASDGIFKTPEGTPLDFKWNIVDGLTDNVTLPANNLVSAAEIFAGYPTNISALNNADGRVILKPLSPALNYGRMAPYGNEDVPTDAGAYGGSQPYVLNGIPIGPYIYNIIVPSIAASNSVIPVSLKAKTNN